MSPSTVDRTTPDTDDDRQDGGLATITVYGKSDSEVKVTFPEQKIEGDVPHIERLEEIDSTSPMQQYIGDDPDIPRLFLLEETVYYLKVEWDDSIDVSKCTMFPYLKEHSQSENSDVVNRSIEFNRIPNSETYRVNFRSHVGKGILDISDGHHTFKLDFEVRSKKLGYMSEYRKMMNEVSEWNSTVLLDRKSPLFNGYVLSETSKTFYEEFLVLKHMFDNMGLEAAYNKVRHDPHCTMDTYVEMRPSWAADSIAISQLPGILSDGNLIKKRHGPIAGSFQPIKVPTTRTVVSYDTPENRLVKDLLMRVRDMLYMLDEKSPTDLNISIRTGIKKMQTQTLSFLSDGWLADVGTTGRIPFESMVLQRRDGYRQLFGMYLILGMGTRFPDERLSDVLYGHNAHLYSVYEYWCYISLFRCLNELSGMDMQPECPQPHSWDSKPVVPHHTFEIELEGYDKPFTVDLHYNQQFTDDGDEFRSYSLKMRPDFTLVIHIDGSKNVFLVNFDAKYKCRPTGRPSEESDDLRDSYWVKDLYKMHTYRDALLKSWGSYILYPGDEQDIMAKPPASWDDEGACVGLPSIGAVPLKPGAGVQCLKNLIRNILLSVQPIDKGQLRLDELAGIFEDGP